MRICQKALFYWRCRHLLSSKLKVCLGTCWARRSILLVLCFAPRIRGKACHETEARGREAPSIEALFVLGVMIGRDSARSSKYPERRGARSLGILRRRGQPVQIAKTRDAVPKQPSHRRSVMLFLESRRLIRRLVMIPYARAQMGPSIHRVFAKPVLLIA